MDGDYVKFQDYEFVAKLGDGGYASVFLTQRKGIHYVVKQTAVAEGELIGGPAEAEKELWMLRYLNIQRKKPDHHRGSELIPILYDGMSSFLPNGEAIIQLAIQYCAGGDLDSMILDGTTAESPPYFVARLLKYAAPALDFLRSQEILHRDLKPGNIFRLSKVNNSFLVADFNSASKKEDVDFSLAVGTPQYRSPEMRSEAGRYSFKSDIWALARICWEIMEGEMDPELEFSQDIVVEKLGEQEWSPAEEAALDLIRKMSAENPRDRISAKSILSQPLLKKFACSSSSIKIIPVQTAADRARQTELGETKEEAMRLREEVRQLRQLAADARTAGSSSKATATTPKVQASRGTPTTIKMGGQRSRKVTELLRKKIIKDNVDIDCPVCGETMVDHENVGGMKNTVIYSFLDEHIRMDHSDELAQSTLDHFYRVHWKLSC